MKPLVACDVVMFGSLDPDGEEFKRCRLTMLGTPTNAVLYTHSDLDGERWLPVDRLTNAKITDGPDGTFTLEGVSDELVNIVGVPVGEAVVKWIVTPRGCRDCG